jgi:hypothetical protein
MDVISIHQWEGQSLAFILTPLIATLAIGLGLFFWRWNINSKDSKPLFGWICIFTGLLFLGSGFMMFTQMFIALTRSPLVPSVLITIILALIPSFLGLVMIKFGLKNEKINIKKRFYIFLIGLIALFFWAGLLIGAFLAMITSVFPIRNRIEKS